jgi:hypothetical protein
LDLKIKIKILKKVFLLYIPDEINGKKVVSVNGFKNSNFERVLIPASVESIGNEAFSGCVNLEKVFFKDGSNLTCLGARAFESCYKLETIFLPHSLEFIHDAAFLNCKNLKKVFFEKNCDIKKLILNCI